MKRTVLIVCVFMVALTLIACGGSKSTPKSDASASAAATSAVASTASSSASSGASAQSASSDVVVPDLVGKNLKDVSDDLKAFDVDYYKADGKRANVFSKSNWRVDAQSLEPGTTVPKNTKLDLTLGHLTEEKAAAEKAEAEAKKAEERANLDYVSVSVAQLVDDLDANALNAKDTYKGGYYRISGVVSTIDASGKYISLDPEGVMFNFTSVRCDLNDDAARDYVRQISTGDYVTVCGQITDVGEVLGYSIDVYFFE